MNAFLEVRFENNYRRVNIFFVRLDILNDLYWIRKLAPLFLVLESVTVNFNLCITNPCGLRNKQPVYIISVQFHFMP
jgi:hypothetical protein